MAKPYPWVVVDVETNGLDPKTHSLLEIAAVVIDAETLEPISRPFRAGIRYTPLDVEGLKSQANDFVYRMHLDNGLWDELARGVNTDRLEVIDKSMVEWLSMFAPARKMPVMGNSARLDMNFMDEYLPGVAAYLDYHMRDVSTIAGIAADWYGAPWFEKKQGHRAIDDVMECIEELKHYRKHVFAGPILKQESGPAVSGNAEIATLLRRRAAMEAPNAAAALAFMADHIEKGTEPPASMLAEMEN